MSAQGPCAWDFVREFVGRWTRTPSFGGNKGDTSAKHVEMVWKKYRQLLDDRKTFVQQYHGTRKGIWDLQVYRSLASAHWAPPDRKPEDAADKAAFDTVTWGKKMPGAENSIERAYHHAIDQAEKFIYIENQYLIGSGLVWQGEKRKLTNDVPKHIVDKILAQAKAGKPFHVYIVKPMFPEGNPIGDSTLEIRKNEWLTAQYMVQALATKLGKKWTDYLSFYFLANWKPQVPINQGDRKHRVGGNDRYMIYVHSKFMIVDDRYFILGSANLNERSLNGDRDSEIACGVWPGFGHEDAAMMKIRNLRLDLWKSHFGAGVESAESPESQACVTSVKSIGDQNYAAFRTLTAPPNGHACRWSYKLGSDGLLAVDPGKSSRIFDNAKLLPDSPKDDKAWRWNSPGSWLIELSRFGE
jgi:phospholipase D1/2